MRRQRLGESRLRARHGASNDAEQRTPGRVSAKTCPKGMNCSRHVTQFARSLEHLAGPSSPGSFHLSSSSSSKTGETSFPFPNNLYTHAHKSLCATLPKASRDSPTCKHCFRRRQASMQQGTTLQHLCPAPVGVFILPIGSSLQPPASSGQARGHRFNTPPHQLDMMGVFGNPTPLSTFSSGWAIFACIFRHARYGRT